MNTARYAHTATILTNGKVLVAGGWNGNSYLNSAELYDPSLNTWTTISSMNTARIWSHSNHIIKWKSVSCWWMEW